MTGADWSEADHRLADEAFEWIDRFKEEGDEITKEFLFWLKRSPAHQHCFLVATFIDAIVDALDDDEVLQLLALFSDP